MMKLYLKLKSRWRQEWLCLKKDWIYFRLKYFIQLDARLAPYRWRLNKIRPLRNEWDKRLRINPLMLLPRNRRFRGEYTGWLLKKQTQMHNAE